MRSVRRVGEAGAHPTSTDHVSGPIQTASNGETVGKNQVNSLYRATSAMMDVPTDEQELRGKLFVSLQASC